MPELVAITAAMPDSTGLLPFAERFPDRVLRRRHRRAARGDLGRRHGHGRAAAGRGGLLARSSPGPFDQVNLDVGLHAAGRLLPRPGRRDRRRRTLGTTACSTWCCSPRCPGMDDVRAVVVPGAPGDAPRRAGPSSTDPSPFAGPRRVPGTFPSTRSGHGLRLAGSQPGRRRVHHRRSARCSKRPTRRWRRWPPMASRRRSMTCAA